MIDFWRVREQAPGLFSGDVTGSRQTKSSQKGGKPRDRLHGCDGVHGIPGKDPGIRVAGERDE